MPRTPISELERYSWIALQVTGLLLSFWCVQPVSLATDVSSSGGKTFEQQSEEVHQLIARGADDEAVALLRRMHNDYPADPSAAINLGDFFGRHQNYAESIHYYEEAIPRLVKKYNASPAQLAHLHNTLVNDYNELGQQRYFSAELCLRILYHLEQAWPYLTELGFGPDQIPQAVEFARKTVGHYEMAAIGPNVRMMEASSGGEEIGARSVKGQELELTLPPDGIDEAVKLQAREAIIARIHRFDASQPPEYAAAPSDRSLDEILKTIDMAFNRIANIHYRKYREHEGAEELLEETWYQSPNVLKTHQQQDGQEGWSLIRDQQVTTFDPAQRQILNREAVENEPGWLMEIRTPHAKYLQQGYDLSIQKLTTPPVFLGALYRGQLTAHLYLLTGKSKKPDGVGWPPVVKVEYVMDVDRGLLVGVREYWHGVLGSGREEELAVTDVVTRWADYPHGIVLPVAGRREQLIDEPPATHRIERTTWRIEYDTVNTTVNPSEFDLSHYKVRQ